jgi:acyl-CoA reductase-like NAD-dependent aldehyde dehydrogenase
LKGVFIKMQNKEWKMLIGGEWVDSSSGETFEDISPVNGEVLWQIPKGTREDAKSAIKAAVKAKQIFTKMTSIERAKFLYKAADRIEAQIDELAEILTKEMGKPIVQAKIEVQITADIFRAFAEESRRISGEVLPSENRGVWSFVVRVPRGVVAAISPWNYPYLLTANKLAAAVVTGNTVVLKPSSDTPVTGLKLGEILLEVGLPKGVINVVTGPGSTVGDELTINPGINVVAATGETVTGKIIAEKAGKSFKKVLLELGGKSPFIVLEDADIDRAVSAALWGKFANAGQICIAVDRILLDEEIAEEFINKFIQKVSNLNIGDPMQPQNHIGPLVNKTQLDRVQELVQDAIDQGANLRLGGKRLTKNVPQGGFFYEPTVLTNVTQEMKLMQDEIFGPVAPIAVFSDVEEIIKVANSVRYGLASAVWTKDINTALKIAEELEFGKVHINDTTFYDEPHGPHGGIKETGMGREGGHYSIEDYMDYKWITINTTKEMYPFG